MWRVKSPSDECLSAGRSEPQSASCVSNRGRDKSSHNHLNLQLKLSEGNQIQGRSLVSGPRLARLAQRGWKNQAANPLPLSRAVDTLWHPRWCGLTVSPIHRENIPITSDTLLPRTRRLVNSAESITGVRSLSRPRRRLSATSVAERAGWGRCSSAVGVWK